MRQRLLILLISFAALCGVGAHAQILTLEGKAFDIDSVKNDFEHQPYFGLYKDNYFIFGTG